MGFTVLDQPSLQKLNIGPIRDLMVLEERMEQLVQSMQVVERDALIVMMLDVEIRPEKKKVPDRIAIHAGRPLGWIARINVVMLAESIEYKGDRKNEE